MNAVAGRMLRSTKRVSNRQRMKQAKEAISKGTKLQFTLMALLAQQGGEATVTGETLRRVGLNAHNMGIATAATPDGALMIRLIEMDAQDSRYLSAEEMRAEIQAALEEHAESVG